MIEKFQWIQERYDELSQAVSQPEIIADTARWQRLLKEHAQLEPAVEAWKRYQAMTSQEHQAEEMLSDPELAPVAQEELKTLREHRTALESEMRLLLLPRDPNDERNVVMEIRAGAGGDEASLFGASLMRMYIRYAERHGYRVEPVSTNMTELGGVKEAVFTLCGPGAFARMKYESGVHRVQRVPTTESGGRIHTSTCTVAVLPEAEDVEVEIAPKDLRIDVYRSTGHGGQCVNTTDSAVRITHLPTGLVVTCQDEKSQLKNKNKALKVLYARLYDMELKKHNEEIAGERKAQVGTGNRNERIRTYNFPQGRLTDHRIGQNLNVWTVIEGELDELINLLIQYDQKLKLEKLAEA